MHRGLLTAADTGLAAVLRAVLTSGDDYTSAAKPSIDWDDAPARAQLIDSRARDGMAMLAALHGLKLDEGIDKAARLLATVLGQDIAEDDNGNFAIVRGTAADRVISTVDPETRHGHKTSAHGFDGYKAHIAVDPDSEIITATTTATTAGKSGNSGDAGPAAHLLTDVLPSEAEADEAAVFGDAAYGAGELLKQLDDNGIHNMVKVQPSSSARAATQGPRSVSMPITTESASEPVSRCSPISACNRVIPSTPSGSRALASFLPAGLINSTS